MADAYSIQHTKWSQNVPADKIKPNEMYGRVRYAYAEYEAAAEQSEIAMFNLPNGARIISGNAGYDALGANTTVSVGHDAYVKSDGTAVTKDVDEFKAAAASTSAGIVPCAATLALGKFSVVDANEDGMPITLTIAGGDGTGTVYLEMLWVLD